MRAVPVCRKKRWYLVLCCTACPRGRSCAELSLDPRNPTHVSVACTKLPVGCKGGRNMRTYGLCQAKHTRCAVETREQASRHTEQLETCHRTVRWIFKDPYFTPWGAWFCPCYCLGKVSYSSGGLTGFNDCVFEEQLHKWPGAHRAPGPHPH